MGPQGNGFPSGGDSKHEGAKQQACESEKWRGSWCSRSRAREGQRDQTGGGDQYTILRFCL